MTPFHKVPTNPVDVMMKRDLLLGQPDEFFKPLFNGRAPTLQERVQCVEVAVQRITCFNVWENDTYRVEISQCPPFVHLDISRHDQQPCTNWRDFQAIKNQLVGPQNEAIELFPSEDRLVDTANQYHLWVMADPNYRFPLGFQQRFVLNKPVYMEDWRNVSMDGAAQMTSAAA
jgi:hypothetical protein